MTDLVLTTFDWVPEPPRGFVRDLRIRWALEEAGLSYRAETVPFRERSSDHFSHQPFGQVPWLKDGDISTFGSGAILLHLGERSDALMPADPEPRTKVIEWLFAALNSVEMAVLPYSIFMFFKDTAATPGRKALDDFLDKRLTHVEAVLDQRDWLADSFSVADIAMSDVLRLADRFDRLASLPACRDYVRRATARPAFRKAHADQLAHFEAADQAKSRLA